jgi:MFS family permease
VLQVTILWFSIFSFLSGFAQNYEQLLILRILHGFGFGAEWAVGAVLLGELVAPAHRGKAIGAVQSAAGPGSMMAALLAGPIAAALPMALGWRVAFFIGVLPALLVFFVRREDDDAEIYKRARARSREQGRTFLPVAIFRPELRRLTGEEDPVGAALSLVGKHGCAVLIKGGHEEGEALADALIETDNITSWQGQRIDTTSTHGTGCTLASAIALFLARGASLTDAVASAREFVRVALYSAPDLGDGAGPLGQADVRLDVGPPGAPRLNQVTLTVHDYDKSVAFYRSLGFQPQPEFWSVVSGMWLDNEANR